MSARSTLRAVVYKVLRHPDSEVTMTARCMSGSGCRWELAPSPDLEAGSVALMSHTAETGHAIFARCLEDMACVVLDDPMEQARCVAVNALEGATKGPAESEPQHTRAET
ncbi:hypothetical protein ACFWBX_28215 [Streptomyces sp. NPDC059991]|uniref:hypothetical protein n=1 Tax=Streptomyces sp. NPDC059991 TaxID=3347028 RepID=UPI00368FB2E9